MKKNLIQVAEARKKIVFNECKSETIELISKAIQKSIALLVEAGFDEAAATAIVLVRVLEIIGLIKIPLKK